MTGDSTFWHKLFWSGSGGTVKCDQRKQRLHGCAFPTTFCQGGQRLKYTGHATKQRKGEQQYVSAWLWKNRQGIPSDSDYCVNVMRRAEWAYTSEWSVNTRAPGFKKQPHRMLRFSLKNDWRHTRYFVEETMAKLILYWVTHSLHFKMSCIFLWHAGK